MVADGIRLESSTAFTGPPIETHFSTASSDVNEFCEKIGLKQVKLAKSPIWVTADHPALSKDGEDESIKTHFDWKDRLLAVIGIGALATVAGAPVTLVYVIRDYMVKKKIKEARAELELPTDDWQRRLLF